MAEEIVIHGDFVQFHGIARCHACQVTNLKCALQESDAGCMSCAGASRQCIFTRTVPVSGPKSTFRWFTLLNKDPGQGLMQPPYNGPTISASAFPDRPAHARQVPISESINGLPPINPASARKFLARSNSSPETEESRSRSGLDPTQRDRLEGPISLLGQTRSRDLLNIASLQAQSAALANIRAQSTATARDPQQQISPRTQATSSETGVASTRSELRSPTSKTSDGKGRNDSYPRLAPRNDRTSIDRQATHEIRDDAVRARTSPLDPDIDPSVLIHRMCPALPMYLLERITQEQKLRFENLYQRKKDHLKILKHGPCPSGDCCLDPSNRNEWRWAGVKHPTPFSGEESDKKNQVGAVATPEYGDEDLDVREGSNGPPAIPMLYPRSRFPAKFECPLCFQPKEYSKPSDWIKHVHEDFQPFLCSFICPDPKSFKRKADWVRHENERHRQLEWWACNYEGCSHKCFRKDNFVQHLVREHKLPEPKLRASHMGLTPDKPIDLRDSRRSSLSLSGMKRRASSPPPDVSHGSGPPVPKVREGTPTTTDAENDSTRDSIWDLVDECRQETVKKPTDEACKFCGAHLTSWKKLTVHLAKHMEEITITLWKAAFPDDKTLDSMIKRTRTASTTEDDDAARPQDERCSPMDTDDDDRHEETPSDSPTYTATTFKSVNPIGHLKPGEAGYLPRLQFDSSNLTPLIDRVPTEGLLENDHTNATIVTEALAPPMTSTGMSKVFIRSYRGVGQIGVSDVRQRIARRRIKFGQDWIIFGNIVSGFIRMRIRMSL
ncbi:MAG: hypothetical protein Q9218_004385 [Villophora microphyllina]